ncbi:nucleolar protein of 40 kDa-like [Mizuhopecten yessoensis]|uniref:Zinc finger CCHC domain-containing protein 17 n=1 Tax=Mizuhopecten yessoensis TaxID=6573 RepID=A0A210QT36_MIZYE|nr:nucleolar protein of 40 kDa-like [Mizuhopecten yessoensis]OWF51913.1 Nucleolar protein of 40 kDa [Mizuhopecten yessoensis]
MSKRHSTDGEERGRSDRYKFFKNESLPNLYFVFQGEVASVKSYGAFIKIPDSKKQGLVHKSQMSKARVDDPTEMLSVGEKVQCKVISIEDDKVSLSMKCVNQTTGQDEDPTNVQLSLDNRQKKQGVRGGRPKIELGAVLDTTCRKCGGHGHLAQDCFHTKGGKSYELVPDLEDDGFPELSEEESSSLKKKRKKEKKPKKEKKKHKKHKHQKQASSEDSSDEERHRKKQKHKHHKSKKYDSSSSSEG